jgi:hypothetical protein
VGDEGVRDVIWRVPGEKIRTYTGPAPDFVTVSPRGKIILSEAKAGRNIDGNKVIEQLSPAMEGLRQKGLVGDVEAVQFIMEQRGQFSGTQYIAQDGYLFDTKKGKRATLNGFNRFIRVIRL